MVIRNAIHVDAYHVVDDAVERGVSYGYNRAHKHVEHPSKDEICAAIETAVMSELCEVLRFD